MNTDNAQKLINFLKSCDDLPKGKIRMHHQPEFERKGSHYFYMSCCLAYLDDVHYCGTAGCIAGSAWVVSRNGDDVGMRPITNLIVNAERFLGITEGVGVMLFTPYKMHDGEQKRTMSEVKNKHAIYVLEKMVQHDKDGKWMYSDDVLRFWNDSFAELGS